MTRCYPQHACARCGRDFTASPTAPTWWLLVADHDGGTLRARQCGCDCGYESGSFMQQHAPGCSERRCHATERMRCEYVSSDDCSMISRVDRDAEACCANTSQNSHASQNSRVSSVYRRA